VSKVLIREVESRAGPEIGKGVQFERVRELAPGEEPPVGATVVEGVKPHDWQEVAN
jgi:hypothetical protein